MRTELTVHFLRKIPKTIRVCATLMLARTFGTYRHSVDDLGHKYHVYDWRGQTWGFPDGPMQD